MSPRRSALVSVAVGDLAMSSDLNVNSPSSTPRGRGRRGPTGTLGAREGLGVAEADDGFDGATRADDRAVLEDGAIKQPRARRAEPRPARAG